MLVPTTALSVPRPEPRVRPDSRPDELRTVSPTRGHSLGLVAAIAHAAASAVVVARRVRADLDPQRVNGHPVNPGS